MRNSAFLFIAGGILCLFTFFVPEDKELVWAAVWVVGVLAQALGWVCHTIEEKL